MNIKLINYHIIVNIQTVLSMAIVVDTDHMAPKE